MCIRDSDKPIADGYTDVLGNVTIILTENMVVGEKYKIVASKDGYLPNEANMTVK